MAMVAILASILASIKLIYKHYLPTQENYMAECRQFSTTSTHLLSCSSSAATNTLFPKSSDHVSGCCSSVRNQTSPDDYIS